jgi:GR25 family glycosyltransferase involved in LPS biosynthesis
MMLPRTFCITLPETPDRTEKARTHFDSVGLVVEFFNGIHAEKFGLKTIFPYEVDHPGSGFNIGFKPVGIWLSHFMLWSALSLQSESHFLVLEIDAKFPSDWRGRVEKALQDTPPDFDMLYIGSCCCEGRPQRRVKNDVWDVRYPLCTHAYIVAKKALYTILMTQRKCYAPIDIGLAFHTLPQLKVMTVLPRIIEQFDTIIPP